MYNHSFIITVTCFKSHIKRAKCEVFNLYHFDFISFEDKDKEISKIVNLISAIISQYKKWNSRTLNVALHISFKRQEAYYNADGKIFSDNVTIYSHKDRFKYSSIEGLIRDILNTMKIADPTIVISEREVFENPSIKYLIKQWYHEN